ncbi:MAG: nucleotide exchange factor GrpE [bacterium]
MNNDESKTPCIENAAADGENLPGTVQRGTDASGCDQPSAFGVGSSNDEEQQVADAHEHERAHGEWAEGFKEEMVSRFRLWLDSQDIAQVAGRVFENAEGTFAPPEAMDLFTLFSELTALKQEVKIASRQWKTGADQWEGTTRGLQKALDALQAEQAQRRREAAEVKNAFLRPLLNDILDIRDRMEQGIDAARHNHPSLLTRVLGRGKETGGLIEGLIEGHKMTLRRLDRVLASYGVTRIEAEGKGFDPFRMRAVEVESRGGLPNGLVIEEIRKGFLFYEEVLRPAEVKVNKIETQETKDQ